MVHEICMFTLVPLSFIREVLTILTVTKEFVECALLSVELFELVLLSPELATVYLGNWT